MARMAREYRATDYTEGLRDTLARATATDWDAGTGWYRTARATAEDMAREYGTDTDTAARVLAVLSPNLRWAQNVQAARAVLAEYRYGTAIVSRGGYWANYAKASRIARGETDLLRGPKVTRFHANIMGDDVEVTVDVWALRAVGCWQDAPDNLAHYHAVAAAYSIVAREYNVSPPALQAVAWAVIRGSAD